ncbi:MAG: hypothetical protein A4E52_01323 [Pelotomaculum sp. PtaB.Bin013]|nr:MAG: hypothetical protein A4E52_01323 [Pelotomaculum sp. PtaB.Bin013]
MFKITMIRKKVTIVIITVVLSLGSWSANQKVKVLN